MEPPLPSIRTAALHECRQQDFVRRRSWLMINPGQAVSWNHCPTLLDETLYGLLLQPVRQNNSSPW
jgi:hypothetical protein